MAVTSFGGIRELRQRSIVLVLVTQDLNPPPPPPQMLLVGEAEQR